MIDGPLDILYVITDLDRGGVPLHLNRLAGAMRDRGWRVGVVSLRPPGEVATMLRGGGVPVASCQGRGGWDVRVLFRLTGMIQRAQPRILHGLLFHANLAVRWAGRRAKMSPDRILCEIQTVEVDNRWHLKLEQWTQSLSRLTIGNSPSVVGHLEVAARVEGRRLRLIRGGIDPGPFQDTSPLPREQLGLSAGTPIVLWVGRMDPVKGLDGLIEAFRIVVRGSPAHLLLVGDGPMRSWVERRIQVYGLERRVHLLGFRDEVRTLLKTADVFVLPSRTEGLPNALMEAMAAGCPVVATNVPGCRDLIRHEVSGLLVPPENADALASSLLGQLTDRKGAMSMASEAAASIARDWTLRATHDAYDGLYREVLAKPPNG